MNEPAALLLLRKIIWHFSFSDIQTIQSDTGNILAAWLSLSHLCETTGDTGGCSTASTLVPASFNIHNILDG